MRDLQASIEIDTGAERVWDVLTDFGSYPDWNPFIRRIAGKPEPGERLEVVIEPPGRRARTFRPVVVVADAPRELRWIGSLRIPGLFNGEHILLIEAVQPARVRFVQRERFTGLLIPLFRKGLVATRAGFEHMNLALKGRAEHGP
jgi:hypothetical protein